MEQWSGKWSWVDRARDWDNELTRQSRAEATQEVKKMVKRHIDMYMVMQHKALSALKNLDPTAMSPKDILAFAKESMGGERLYRTDEAGITPGGNHSSGQAPIMQQTLADTIRQAYNQRKERGDDADD